MSFVFYDTETTGISTAFDQILQFAAIRTDDRLRELDRFEIRCRLLPHVVASPGAMRVTGVGADMLDDPALPTHYEMVRRIRQTLLAWSPAVFIGHNSIGFDEHLLRQALYKTLHGPYLTNTNGNGRTDSLRMIQAVARFAPGALTVPIGEKGRPVFKLDRLAPANGFDHANAHDALADVEATIHMCRLMAERVPELWDGFRRFAHKAPAADFVLGEDVFWLTDFYFARAHSWAVTAIAPNPDNGAEILVFDLAQDPVDLIGLDDAALADRLRERPRPVRGLRTNAAPVVLPYDTAPQDIRDGVPAPAELARRAAIIRRDATLRDRLVGAYRATREPFEPATHVEERIYDGFIGKADEALLDRFHAADWDGRPAILAQLSDDRLRALGNRLFYADAPHLLSTPARRDYDRAVAHRLLAEPGDVPWLTLRQALTEADDLLASAKGAEAGLLRGHRDRLLRQVEWAEANCED